MAVNMAVKAHNTHQAFRYPHSEILHGRLTFNVKIGNALREPCNTTDATGIVDTMKKKVQETHTNMVKAFHRDKNYYDRKAQASPLKINDFTFLLNKRLSNRSEKFPLRHLSGSALQSC